MHYKPFDTACVPKNWGISDALGQSKSVFSDKIGTLTQNVTEFQKRSIHGAVYGEGITKARHSAVTREGRVDAVEPEELTRTLKDAMMSTLIRLFWNWYPQIDKLTLASPKLAEDIADRTSEQAGTPRLSPRLGRLPHGPCREAREGREAVVPGV